MILSVQIVAPIQKRTEKGVLFHMSSVVCRVSPANNTKSQRPSCIMHHRLLHKEPKSPDFFQTAKNPQITEKQKFLDVCQY